ncbi:MAG: sel1 repeat family protein [Gammaproteobacteria bacterium]|nr:sel1 repeat family protein [Gammaproteobacteria bacterium]
MQSNMFGRKGFCTGQVLLVLALFSGQLFADTSGGQAAILKGDFPRAFKEFKTDADKGIAHAQAVVGVMLHLGQGVKRNLPQAFSWYKKAAEQGYEAGVANVGIMYYKGAGTPQDDVKAYAWLDLASYIRGGREHNAKARAASFLSPAQLKKARQLAASLRKKFDKK